MHLNAGLKILVLPIRAELSSGSEIVRDPSDVHEIAYEDSGVGPFLPERLLGSKSAVLGGELGLAAHGTHAVTATTETLWFGHSKGTLEDDPNEPTWSGGASVCASLWHTDHGPVLTIERIHALGEKSVEEGEKPIEPFRGKDGLRQTLTYLLRGTSLTPNSSVSELLAGYEGLADGASASSLLDLYIESPEVVRGVRLTEGLLVHVEADATEAVSRIVLLGEKDSDNFARTFSRQAETVPWEWRAESLVDEPVEDDARIAIREDGRCVLLNLEAMSVYHDYDGIGGRHLVIACIPQVASIARLASECAFVASTLQEFRPEDADVTEKVLKDLEQARIRVESAQKRKSLTSYSQRFSHKEKFKTWTHGGGLAAKLSDALEERASSMTDEMEHIGFTISRFIDAKIQRTTLALQREEERRNARRPSRILSESVALGVAALSLLVALLMTTAAAPAWEGSGTVGMWPWSFVVVGGTLIVGTILGAIIRKLR